MYQDILTFWFAETAPKSWWSAAPEFDALVQARFGDLLRRAAQGELSDWRASPGGRLAEILVLDQFSRNAYRDTPAAFAQDPMALALSQEALAAGAHRALTPIECAFLFMPYMHSESALIHRQAEALFRDYTPKDNHDFELRHKAIIDRFGRYPHRNAILGRASSAQEIAFLKQPGSRF